jgi:hypothetical protein
VSERHSLHRDQSPELPSGEVTMLPHAAEQSKSVVGRTVWEAVFQFIVERQPVSGAEVLRRFANDDAEFVTGVLALSHRQAIAHCAFRRQVTTGELELDTS